MKKQYAVIGLGRFGTSVARQLYDLGQEVLAIDTCEEPLHNVAEGVTHTIAADSTDGNALKKIGIKNFDVVVVAIGENIQASIMTVMLLKELGVPYVVAKAINLMHGKVLEKLGVDRVVYPERDMGKRVAHNLVSANMIDFIELTHELRISEVIAQKEMFGKDLQSLNFRSRYNVNVILIKRISGQILFSPGANDRVEAGDILVLAGETNSLERLEKSWEN